MPKIYALNPSAGLEPYILNQGRHGTVPGS